MRSQFLFRRTILSKDRNSAWPIATQALAMADATTVSAEAVHYRTMATVLTSIQERPPESLREAIQLFWLFNMVAETLNYGRIDVWLGDFYANDLESGRESRESAMGLLSGLWRTIGQQRYDGCGPANANCRMVVGGRGRPNEKNADLFAMAAMDVTLKNMLPEPNLTLRFHKEQNPALMKRAFDLIGAGCVHPTLYNDDVHIPSVQKAYRVTEREAEQYIPVGCGEIMIDHRAIASPISTMHMVMFSPLFGGIRTPLFNLIQGRNWAARQRDPLSSLWCTLKAQGRSGGCRMGLFIPRTAGRKKRPRP